MPKIKYSEELKLEVINYVISGNSMRSASNYFGISKPCIQKWVDGYREHGSSGIRIRQNTHTQYSGEYKVNVVEYKRKQGLSARQTAAYFNIASIQSVLSWERKYEQEGAFSLLKETRGKGNLQTGSIKGRKPKCEEPEQYETLREENYRLRMENDYLKKLNALVFEREKSQNRIKQK